MNFWSHPPPSSFTCNLMSRIFIVHVFSLSRKKLHYSPHT
ncbi:hypothetical protein CLOSTASPAR_03602 [[Clostridium] asparagiforme DSM 15981]|uniref:Uncharacterized protein n=1 Tax=[Clostridium] asparagiforme DSM 15981 TaxID=518636 RepID=C0D2W2_9FIRM|nr:hypothetical protein CLOSTASPAR_03602 [[Clostridium] asparagiforme DSM 15981]